MPNWAGSIASKVWLTRWRIFRKIAINDENPKTSMIAQFVIGSCLVATTVTIHAAGLGIVLSHVLHYRVHPDTRFWAITWLLIRIAWWLILVHTAEIAVWALFFWWQECLPDVESAFYFS